MKQLIIIGAGGMGRTYYDIACESIGYNQGYYVKGFIDDDLSALDGFHNYPPLLGKISDYHPAEDDVFICSMGGMSRKKCIQEIVGRGGTFVNLIHKTARLGSNVRLGSGNLVAAFSSIGADAIVGDFNMIQSYTVIGHDVRIGNWNRIDTHVTCVGGTVVGNETDIYTSSVLNHGVVVEDNAHVGACSFVIRRVKSGTTVMGNPARRLI